MVLAHHEQWKEHPMNAFEEDWYVQKARVIKAAEDVVRVANGERGHRVRTLAAAHGELADALEGLDAAGKRLYEAGQGDAVD
jgi:hypothetical protein